MDLIYFFLFLHPTRTQRLFLAKTLRRKEYFCFFCEVYKTKAAGHWKQVTLSVNKKVFLFRVQNLSVVFRGKFLSSLQKHIPQEKSFIRSLYKTNWVVYAKEPFAGPAQVIEYLGRYTHKVTISNHRLMNINDSGVTFRFRDYRDNRQKIMTLDGAEFLRRFCLHILSKRFIRLRHYGLLSTAKRPLLRELQRGFNIIVPVEKPKKTGKTFAANT